MPQYGHTGVIIRNFAKTSWKLSYNRPPPDPLNNLCSPEVSFSLLNGASAWRVCLASSALRRDLDASWQTSLSIVPGFMLFFETWKYFESCETDQAINYCRVREIGGQRARPREDLRYCGCGKLRENYFHNCSLRERIGNSTKQHNSALSWNKCMS